METPPKHLHENFFQTHCDRLLMVRCHALYSMEKIKRETKRDADFNYLYEHLNNVGSVCDDSKIF